MPGSLEGNRPVRLDGPVTSYTEQTDVTASSPVFETAPDAAITEGLKDSQDEKVFFPSLTRKFPKPPAMAHGTGEVSLTL